jgi:predicted dehydrogenase
VVVKSSIGLIIGVGSVGRRHASVMAKRYSQLVVVDVNVKAQEWAAKEFGSATVCATSLDEVAEFITLNCKDVTAVIASWGPHHFAAITQLVNLGVRKIFCEKPLATSLRQLQSIRSMCLEHEVAFTVGLHLRYRGIVEFVQQTALKHLGGLPSTMVVDGGARCISTTGTHWLDFAIAVFACSPKSVSAALHPKNINPRSPNLQYWSGCAAWEFVDGQQLSIVYDNKSSVHERTRLYTPTGVLEIDPNLQVTAFSRNKSEVAQDSRVVRVGEVSRAQPIGEFVTDFSEVLSVQLDEIEGLRPVVYSLDAAIESSTALVAAFESSHLKRHLSLPPDQAVVDQSLDWNIS